MASKTAAPVGPLPKRLPGIDLLRGLAASAVVVSHVGKWPWGVAGGRAEGARHFLDQLGTWGVGVFFVLSGACIHLPMARRFAVGESPKVAKLDLKAYFARRLRRIYPPHALVIGLSWLVAALFILPPQFSGFLSVPTATQFWAHVFMVHTFVPGATYSINCVLWTIAIEAHFYMVYPLLLRLRRRFSIAALCAALFGLMLALRGLDHVLPVWARGVLTYNFPGLLWQWVLGAVLAEWLVLHPPRPRHGAIALTVAIASALAACALARMPQGIVALAVAGPPVYAVVVVVCAATSTPRSWGLRAIEWIGYRSYSLYLTHPIALTLMLALAGARLTARGSYAAPFVLGLASSYALGAVYFSLVESRFLSPHSTPRAAAQGSARLSQG